MREIKFRAWYQELMYTWNHIEKKTVLKFIENPKVFIGIQIMQFTGLKDKNGKEIYEGDIVIQDYSIKGVESSTICIIEFSKGSFVGYSKQLNQYFQPGSYFEDCKVIGNIYENPKLLDASCEVEE